MTAAGSLACQVLLTGRVEGRTSLSIKANLPSRKPQELESSRGDLVKRAVWHCLATEA